MGENVIVPSRGVFPAANFLEDSPDLIGFSLSCHRLLHPDGSITVCVDDDRVAYHAGESQFGELRNLNQVMLGMEWLVAGDWDYERFIHGMRAGTIKYTDEQYESGAWQYAQWMMDHTFGRDRIVSHSSVAGDEVRGPGLGKHDPGKGFNWPRLQESISRHLTAAGYMG
jgi:N-acetyl-anhydromuramyl-L-alanine amidase AmpD